MALYLFLIRPCALLAVSHATAPNSELVAACVSRRIIDFLLPLSSFSDRCIHPAPPDWDVAGLVCAHCLFFLSAFFRLPFRHFSRCTCRSSGVILSCCLR